MTKLRKYKSLLLDYWNIRYSLFNILHLKTTNYFQLFSNTAVETKTWKDHVPHLKYSYLHMDICVRQPKCAVFNDNNISLQKPSEVSSEMHSLKHAEHIYERFGGLRMSFLSCSGKAVSLASLSHHKSFL